MRTSKAIVLTGFMGVGKTTLGRLLADRLAIDFVDTDDLIIEAIGMSISDFFTLQGEVKFRAIERDLVAQLCIQSKPRVIALGGGALTSYGLVDLIKQHTTLVYLSQEIEVLFQILKNAKTKRPKIAQLKDGELYTYITNLLKEREPAYQKADISYTPQYNPIQTDITILIDLLRENETISTEY